MIISPSIYCRAFEKTEKRGRLTASLTVDTRYGMSKHYQGIDGGHGAARLAMVIGGLLSVMLALLTFRRHSRSLCQVYFLSASVGAPATVSMRVSAHPGWLPGLLHPGYVICLGACGCAVSAFNRTRHRQARPRVPCARKRGLLLGFKPMHMDPSESLLVNHM